MEHSYLLYHRTFHCAGCDHEWETSELYRVEINGHDRRLQPQLGAPAAGKAFGISHIPIRQVAVCHMCGPELEARRSQELEEAEARWRETLKRKSAETPDLGPGIRIAARPSGTSPRKPTPETRLEDL